jgi:hypothetical protein
MLISMPTGTSTIFGVFQAIVGLLAHYGRDSACPSTLRLTRSFKTVPWNFELTWQQFVTNREMCAAHQ